MKLSIIICTKDRPNDLLNCISSIVGAVKSPLFEFVEILIIDDGCLEKDLIYQMENSVASEDIRIRYLKKNENPGLFYSRKYGVENAEGGIILFLDDDTEIEEDYLFELGKTYHENPDCAGVGGVDINLRVSWYYKLYYRLFLLSSGRPGNISVSGTCGSCIGWINHKNIFRTEFLIGFNMSYKKDKVKNIPPAPWFKGYSAGEDIFISYFASLQGDLLVNPLLRVLHNCSSLSRESLEKTKYSSTLNQYFFMKYFKFPFYSRILFFYSHFGLILLNLIRYNKYGPMKGYFLGMKTILKDMFRKKEENE